MELKMAIERHKKLEEIGAPQVMIDSLSKTIEMYRKGNTCIRYTEFAKIEYKHHEVKKGRSGKVYISFNDNVNYFPQAKFGPMFSLDK